MNNTLGFLACFESSVFAITLVVIFCLGAGLDESDFIFPSGSLSPQPANVAATIITRICFMPISLRHHPHLLQRS